jgi:hypothetical protein
VLGIPPARIITFIACYLFSFALLHFAIVT